MGIKWLNRTQTCRGRQVEHKNGHQKLKRGKDEMSVTKKGIKVLKIREKWQQKWWEKWAKIVKLAQMGSNWHNKATKVSKISDKWL